MSKAGQMKSSANRSRRGKSLEKSWKHFENFSYFFEFEIRRWENFGKLFISNSKFIVRLIPDATKRIKKFLCECRFRFYFFCLSTLSLSLTHSLIQRNVHSLSLSLSLTHRSQLMIRLIWGQRKCKWACLGMRKTSSWFETQKI